MTEGSEERKQMIHAKVVELAQHLGADASALKYHEFIPLHAGLDSAAVMELVLWYETAFDLDIPDEHLNADNLGTVDSMAEYIERRAEEH